jgi:hypothetical protein
MFTELIPVLISFPHFLSDSLHADIMFISPTHEVLSVEAGGTCNYT